jgi:hypothetical protein
MLRKKSCSRAQGISVMPKSSVWIGAMLLSVVLTAAPAQAGFLAGGTSHPGNCRDAWPGLPEPGGAAWVSRDRDHCSDNAMPKIQARKATGKNHRNLA